MELVGDKIEAVIQTVSEGKRLITAINAVGVVHGSIDITANVIAQCK